MTNEFSTLQAVTAFKLSKEAKQKLKENLVEKRCFFCEKIGEKKLKFFKIPLLEWLQWKNAYYWPTDFLHENT